LSLLRRLKSLVDRPTSLLGGPGGNDRVLHVLDALVDLSPALSAGPFDSQPEKSTTDPRSSEARPEVIVAFVFIVILLLSAKARNSDTRTILLRENVSRP
jgi:hypothetical protein